MAGDEKPNPDARQARTVVFRQPIVQPGTPEAEAAGCLCSFERNMAGFVSAEREDIDGVIVVLHKNCPLHEIVDRPMDDVLGDE